MERSGAQSTPASPNQTAPHEGHPRTRHPYLPPDAVPRYKSTSLAWWATITVGSRPMTVVKLAVASPTSGLASATARPCSAVSLSNKSRRALSRSRLAAACNTARCARHNRATIAPSEGGCCGSELQGGDSPDSHQFRSNSNKGSVQGAVPRAITRSSMDGEPQGTKQAIGFIGRVRTDLATQKQLQLDGAPHLARNTNQTGLSVRRWSHRQDRARVGRLCTAGKISQHAFRRR